MEARAPGSWRGRRVIELGAGEDDNDHQCSSHGFDSRLPPFLRLRSAALIHAVSLCAVGCGLVGLVLACLGASVELTDLPEVVAIMEANIEKNRDLITEGGADAVARALVWGEPSTYLPGDDVRPGGRAEPDVIVAADVIYHRHLFDPLLECLLHLTDGAGPTEVLLSHVRRWKTDRHFFRKAGRSFAIAEVVGGPDGDADADDDHLLEGHDRSRRGGTKGVRQGRGEQRIYRLTRLLKKA
jgi:hypothetical protein